MEESRKNELKDIIKKQISETASGLKGLKESIKPISPDNAIGRLTRMEAINEKSVAEAAFRQAEEKLAQLKNVLERIDQEEFGLCAECEEEISWARLKAIPYGPVCMSCLSNTDR